MSSAAGSIDAGAALERLKEGQQRFLQGKTRVNYESATSKRKAHAETQHPFAIILACADSRVPPEMLFDQDISDLFVIRVAGNVTDPFILGSIQYAIQHLGSRLVLVLGHERCGAVKAAIAQINGEARFRGVLGQLVHALVPLVEPVVRGRHPETKEAKAALLDDAIRANVRHQVNLIHDALENLGDERLTLGLWLDRIRVVGARYDLDDGTVDFHEPPIKAKRVILVGAPERRPGHAAGGERPLGIDGDGALAGRAGQLGTVLEIAPPEGAHKIDEARFMLRAGDRYLSANANGGVDLVPRGGDHEELQLVLFGDDKFGFVTAAGRFLGLGEGGRLVTSAALRETEHFRIVEIED